MTAIKLTPPFITGLSRQRVSHIIQMTTEKSEGREFDPHPGQLVLRVKGPIPYAIIPAALVVAPGDVWQPFRQQIF